MERRGSLERLWRGEVTRQAVERGNEAACGTRLRRDGRGTHTPPHSHTHYLSHTLSLSNTHPLSHTYTLSHTHRLTRQAVARGCDETDEAPRVVWRGEGACSGAVDARDRGRCIWARVGESGREWIGAVHTTGQTDRAVDAKGIDPCKGEWMQRG